MSSNRLNRSLAIGAMTIATFALLLSFVSPTGMNRINDRPNYISVVELAEKIRNHEEVQLIDLRALEIYNEFHLPTAKHIPLYQVLTELESQNGPFVFYSGDDPLTRQLWRQLPDSLKQQSNVLYGGVHDWYERLLYPELPLRGEVKNLRLYQKIHDLSLFYGGQPDFIEGSESLDYYNQDFSNISWPKSHRQNGLVRKGC